MLKRVHQRQRNERENEVRQPEIEQRFRRETEFSDKVKHHSGEDAHRRQRREENASEASERVRIFEDQERVRSGYGRSVRRSV